MTGEELRAKYKNAPNREDMTIEEERELVSDQSCLPQAYGFIRGLGKP